MDLQQINTKLFDEQDNVKNLLIISLLYNALQISIKKNRAGVGLERIFEDGGLLSWCELSGGAQFDMVVKFLYKLSVDTGTKKRDEVRVAALRVCDMMGDDLFLDYSSKMIAGSGGAGLCGTALVYAEKRLGCWNARSCKFFEALLFAMINVRASWANL